MKRAAMAVVMFVCAAAMTLGNEVRAQSPQEKSRQVIIVTDESDRMEPLAKYLKEKGGIESTIVDYKKLPEGERKLPEDLSKYEALIGYIHGNLDEPTELKIIEYTKAGGRFVCLHHMVSSGKSKNKYYFDFLGLHMDEPGKAREAAQPDTHYMWREHIEKQVVNLAPEHFITKTDITWPEKVNFKPTDVEGAEEKEYPAFTMKVTEVYSNVKRTDGKEKTLLMGYIYTDDRNGVTHKQATDGWTKSAGKGQIVYIQPGHFVEEFTDPNNILNQLILNAVNWKPEN